MKIVYYIIVGIFSVSLYVTGSDKALQVPTLKELSLLNITSCLYSRSAYDMCVNPAELQGFLSRLTPDVMPLLQNSLQNLVNSEHESRGDNAYYQSTVELHNYYSIVGNSQGTSFVALYRDKSTDMITGHIWIFNQIHNTYHCIDKDLLNNLSSTSQDCIFWHPQMDNIFACITSDNKLYIYHINASEKTIDCVFYTEQYSSKIQSITWSPDGAHIAVRCITSCYIIALEDKEQKLSKDSKPRIFAFLEKQVELHNYLEPIKWNCDNSLALDPLPSGNIVSWEYHKGTWKRNYTLLPMNIQEKDQKALCEKVLQSYSTTCNAWNRQLTYFVYFRATVNLTEDITLYSYKPDTGIAQIQVLDTNLPAGYATKSVDWNEQGDLFAYIKDTHLKVCKIDASAENDVSTCILNYENKRIKNFALSPDGTTIVIVYQDNSLKIWSMAQDIFGYEMQDNGACELAPHIHNATANDVSVAIQWNLQGTAFCIKYSDELAAGNVLEEQGDGQQDEENDVIELDHYRIISKSSSTNTYCVIKEIKDVKCDAYFQWTKEGSSFVCIDRQGNIHRVYVACPALSMVQQLLVLAGCYANKNDINFNKYALVRALHKSDGLIQKSPLYNTMPIVAQNIIKDSTNKVNKNH